MPIVSEPARKKHLLLDALKSYGVGFKVDVYDHQYFQRNRRFGSSELWISELRFAFSKTKSDVRSLHWLDFGSGSGEGFRAVIKRELLRPKIAIAYEPNLEVAEPDAKMGDLPTDSSDFKPEITYTSRKEFVSSFNYDLVTMVHCIGHMINPVEEITFCLRLLREKGELVVVTPNAKYKRMESLISWIRGYSPDMTVVRYFSSRHLMRLLKKAGCNDVTIYTIGELPKLHFWSRSCDRHRSRIIAVATAEKGSN